MILLGSGEARTAGVGNKGTLLDRAALAGLPVPTGWILLDNDEEVPVPSSPVAVRSAFSTEDGNEESLAGFFETRLNIEPAAISQAVEQVRKSASRRPGHYRRDVLVQHMVQPRHAGVAFTEDDYEDDLVNYTQGTAERLVSGQVAGERALLPKLRGREIPTAAGFLARLQRLLRGVRGVFDHRDWDVEWADDGRVCWLLQVRPITRPPRRNEAFTLANHKEILPGLPSVLMTSIIESCSREVFGYYREFDPELPADRPFIEVIEGRPLINISLLSDMMRILGLPTSLVTGNIGGSTDRPFPANPARLFHKAPILFRMALAQLHSVRDTEPIIDRMHLRIREPFETFTEALAALRLTYIDLVRGMFALTAAMSGPLRMLRAAGVLEELGAGHETVSTQVYSDLHRMEWSDYIEKHGHRGIYESDIARPRFIEDPAPLLAVMQSVPPPRNPARGRSLWSSILQPLWWQASRTIQARENLRSETMRVFLRIRRDLVRLCGQSRIEPETLWLLTWPEARSLDAGWRPDAPLLAERRAERERLEACRLPDLVHRFDDFSACYSRPAMHQGGRVLTGISLTRGSVRGRAWVLREPSAALPEGFDAQSTILVAPAVDAGWIPTFHLVAGAVVETGGDLSHGSILIREIGLPAITNVAGATTQFGTGDTLWLRAATGHVEKQNGLPEGRP